jgi:hypothetical protein
MLANIRSRHNDLGLADVVIRDEHNLQQITNILVVVDHIPNFVDEVNNRLGHPVAWCSLSSKDGNLGHHLLALFSCHGLDLQVSVNAAKDIELLALVLVNTLNLNVKQRSRVDLDSSGLENELGKSSLVGSLDIIPLLSERLVIDKSLKLMKERKVLEEAESSQLAGNQSRKARIRLVKPSTRSDSVCHVGELVRAINRDKVLEDGRLDEIRVQLGDSIDLVGPDKCQVGHAHHLGGGLFNDGNAAKEFTILGEHALDILQELQINVVDDLQVTREEVLHQWNRPFLERLGQDCVVGIAKDLVHNAPCFVPIETFQIDENALQLRDGECWMGIVELDGDLVRKLPPCSTGLLETTNDVVERSSTPKVLLLQSKFLSALQATHVRLRIK